VSRSRLRHAAVIVVMAAYAGWLVSCSDSDDPEAWSVDIDGQAQVVDAEGGTEALEQGRQTLEAGQQIRVADSAVVRLPNGASAELRAGADGDAVLVLGTTPELRSGELLLKAGSDTARLNAGGVLISLNSNGVARIRRSSGVTVGVYRGLAGIDARGRILQGGVPALRQITIASGGSVPRKPVPLVYNDSDQWDLDYLGEAINLDRELDDRVKNLVASSNGQVPDEAFLSRVLPVLATTAGFGEGLLQRPRSTSELVIGASIALGSGPDFVDSWGRVFGFRSAGAKWGIVALDAQIPPQGLLLTVEGVLRRLASGLTITTPTDITPPSSSGIAPRGSAQPSVPAARPGPANPPANDPSGPLDPVPVTTTTTTPPPPVTTTTSTTTIPRQTPRPRVES
jgi:hypothetical protein